MALAPGGHRRGEWRWRCEGRGRASEEKEAVRGRLRRDGATCCRDAACGDLGIRRVEEEGRRAEEEEARREDSSLDIIVPSSVFDWMDG